MLEEVKRECAPESLKTRKARQKLSESFKEQDAQITPEALKGALESIRTWIAKYNSIRVPIQKQTIELFTGNREIADVSNRVKKLAETLSSLFS